MKALTLLAICGFFSACQITMPIGEKGEYGEVYAGYRPPNIGPFNVTHPQLLQDK